MAATQDDMTEITKHNSYADYLLTKVNAQREHMNYLQAELQYAKSDKWAYWAAIIGLAAVVAVMWANWPAGGS
jgi:hypothetical protein